MKQIITAWNINGGTRMWYEGTLYVGDVVTIGSGIGFGKGRVVMTNGNTNKAFVSCDGGAMYECEFKPETNVKAIQSIIGNSDELTRQQRDAILNAIDYLIRLRDTAGGPQYGQYVTSNAILEDLGIYAKTREQRIVEAAEALVKTLHQSQYEGPLNQLLDAVNSK